jgi:RimJ/RimL family protein N-acetyltransferase
MSGDGIVLRAFVDSDIPRLVDMFSDPEVARWNPGPITLDEVRAWAEHRNDWTGGDHASWAVSDPDGTLLGSVSLYKIDSYQQKAEIGYQTAPWARRRGVAVAAVNTTIRAAFDVLALHRVVLFHAVDNEASCRVALRAGFQLEGLLRQGYRYGDGTYHDEHVHGLLASDVRTSGRPDRVQIRNHQR